MKMTATDILLRWLIPGKKFKTHQISTELSDWGKYNFDTLYSPGTYDRKFRLLKNDLEFLKNYGIVIGKFVGDKKGKENIYEVIKIDPYENEPQRCGDAL